MQPLCFFSFYCEHAIQITQGFFFTTDVHVPVLAFVTDLGII